MGVSTPNRLLSFPNRVHSSALGSKDRAEGGRKAKEGEGRACAPKIDGLKAQNLPSNTCSHIRWGEREQPLKQTGKLRLRDGQQPTPADRAR